MRCLSCNYDLRELTEHRCPECGREFDPNDDNTFEWGRDVHFTWLQLLLVDGLIFAVVLSITFIFLRGLPFGPRLIVACMLSTMLVVWFLMLGLPAFIELTLSRWRIKRRFRE